MKTLNKLMVSGMGLASLLLVACSSSTDAPDDDAREAETVAGPTDEGVTIKDEDDCRPREYSEVVPAYIAYADVHCEGWSGKVFCEYESLSSTWGPGWGTCQCYNDFMCIKRGRSCRNWWGCW